MRVLQLIDSLRSGGAEKMSVNYANALAKRIDKSYLCCTRMEGLLKSQLSPEVGYLFLNKKNTLDLKAFLKLRKFVKSNKIDLIQVHSSSWFLGVLVKLSLPKLKLVWHDHYGRELTQRRPGILKFVSSYFDGVIAVNSQLKKWAEENLKSKEVRFFRNFLPEQETYNFSKSDHFGLLSGEKGFRIICVANLRQQKDHLNLFRAFAQVEKIYPQASLHLVGKDLEDEYSARLKDFVEQKKLQNKILFYGEQENVQEYLESAELGVLSSSSEGLPVALLEYGRAGLPVVCTNVGECAEVVGAAGILVPPGNAKALADAIKTYISNDVKRLTDAGSFQKHINRTFLEEKILSGQLTFFRNVLKK